MHPVSASKAFVEVEHRAQMEDLECQHTHCPIPQNLLFLHCVFVLKYNPQAGRCVGLTVSGLIISCPGAMKLILRHDYVTPNPLPNRFTRPEPVVESNSIISHVFNRQKGVLDNLVTCKVGKTLHRTIFKRVHSVL